MKTIIKMITGDTYKVFDQSPATVTSELEQTADAGAFHRVVGTDGRADFYINPLAVSAVFPAVEERS